MTYYGQSEQKYVRISFQRRLLEETTSQVEYNYNNNAKKLF